MIVKIAEAFHSIGLLRQILAANQVSHRINTIRFNSMGAPFINLDFHSFSKFSILAYSKQKTQSKIICSKLTIKTPERPH